MQPFLPHTKNGESKTRRLGMDRRIMQYAMRLKLSFGTLAFFCYFNSWIPQYR
jgi:hypothetical protein